MSDHKKPTKPNEHEQTNKKTKPKQNKREKKEHHSIKVTTVASDKVL